MKYDERLGIILMRDNGPRRSFRVSRRLFYGLLIFFACLPLVCAGLLWQGFKLVERNAALVSLLQQREAELKVARASARRLEGLEVLLQENTIDGREQILHRLAMAEENKARELAASHKPARETGQATGKPGSQARQAIGMAAQDQESAAKQAAQAEKPNAQAGKKSDDERSLAEQTGSRKQESADSSKPASGQPSQQTTLEQAGSQSDKADTAKADNGPAESVKQEQGKPDPDKNEQLSGKARDEGPGHEEFQEIDKHLVRVGNVQARAFTGNRLRIAIDLHNTDKQEQAVGSVRTTLLTASGDRHLVVYAQKDAGDFRISRFKRAVMVSKIPHEFRTANAQIQVEILMHDGTLAYRNIYSVEH